MTIKFSDITGGGIPYGNNAGRPANPGIGKLYSNGEAQRLELYTASGWNNIVQEVPGVSGITGNYSEQTNSGTIVIAGTNFVSGAIASATGNNGVEVQASSTTFNSIVQLTATFTGLSNQYEPYDIKVTNTSNLFGILPDALFINASPVWQTAAGSLGTFNEQISISVSATATDSDSTISYSLDSGSTLPSGITLNTSTGLISGTLPDITTDTTYTFTINATDGLNTIPRTFSMTATENVAVEALVVGGGGGGGNATGSNWGSGGGGGAGGYRTGTLSLSRGAGYLLTVGSGGQGAPKGSTSNDATPGLSSVFSSITSAGGGIGGSANFDGGSGSSGGGGGYNQRSGGSGNIPSTSPSQGSNGGGSSETAAAGGGGGAGAVGSTGVSGQSGAGGVGLSSSITGITTFYAGGGGGGYYNGGTAGAGGNGGGGAGGTTSTSASNPGNPGTANTGGGGGGGSSAGSLGSSNAGAGGAGGSGVVIIAYPNTRANITTIPGTLTYTLDTTTRAGYKVYRFTAGSGTITF
jgi:hypothetical protein